MQGLWVRSLVGELGSHVAQHSQKKICICVCVCIYIYMCVCVCVCVYIYIKSYDK